MRSSGIGDRGWRPIVGVLAIGVIAFGLSMQGAPAGEDDRPQVDRAALRDGAATVDTVAFVPPGSAGPREELAPFVPASAPPSADQVLPEGERAVVPGEASVEVKGDKQFVTKVTRVEESDIMPDSFISGPSGNSGRCTLGVCTAQIPENGACTCDIECDDQLNCNGRERCVAGFCELGDPAIPNDQTGCLEAVDVAGGTIPGGRGNRQRCHDIAGEPNPCETFANDACTDAQVCVDITCTSDYCTDTFLLAERKFCFSAIPHCTLTATISDFGDGTCVAGTDCPSGTCIDLEALGYAAGAGGVCKCTADAHCNNGDCNERSGLCRPTGYECSFEDQTGDCDLVIGSCCVPNVNPQIPPVCDNMENIETCNLLGGKWISDQQPEELNTSPSEVGCWNHCPYYSSGIRYPLDANAGSGSDPLNPAGTATVDLGPVNAHPCNGNGYLSIGDDYDLAGTDPLALERFSWTGASDAGGLVVFEFRDFDPPYTIAAELRVGGISTNRGTFVVGDRENPLFQGMRQAVIPNKGWVVMRSPTFEADGSLDDNHHWYSHHVAGAEVGTNDPTQMWVNGAPVTNFIAGASPDVLRFEIRGVPLALVHDACCTDSGGAGTCSTAKEPWECKVCSNNATKFCVEDTHCWVCAGGTGTRPCLNDDQCALFGEGPCIQTHTCGTHAYLGQRDACQENNDCDSAPGAGDGVCQFYANALAPITAEFPPVGWCYIDCNPNPCTTGACCEADGDCTLQVSQAACNAVPGTWQGYGQSCDPNCCPNTIDTSGEFCWQATPHVLTVPPSVTSFPNVVTITIDNDKANLPGGQVVLGSGPISGQCEHSSCINLAAAPGSWSRKRCISNANCTLPETCQHQPCSWDDPVGGTYACKSGTCQSDPDVRCRTAGDCPQGFQGDNCQDIEVCERLDCGDPNVPGLGWVVTGQDDVRWEAFTLSECGLITLDHCCTDDNPNTANGISDFGLPTLYKGCEGSPSRLKYCEGLSKTDNPTGTVCTTDADCLVGTCTTGGACHSDDDCALGSCTTASIKCRQDGDCPTGETCGGAGACGGGTQCEPLRDKCGASPVQEFPAIDSNQSQFGWFCGDGNPAVRYELIAGTYYLPIRALQTCTSDGAPCNSDGDCLNAGTCQIRHHEYQLHINVEKCQESACCHIDPICEFTDPEVPASRCDDPTSGSCSVTTGQACTVDGDCPQGTCSSSNLGCPLEAVDCPSRPGVGAESCVATVCTLTTPIVCSTDADCLAGEQCAGAERCIYGDCPQQICSNSANGAIVPCTSNNDCLPLGTCSGAGPETCHDDFDCPTGTCSAPNQNKHCRIKEDCPGAASQCNTLLGAGKPPETCTGGLICEPQVCVDVPLCDVIPRPDCIVPIAEGGLDGFWSEGAAICDPPLTPAFENVCYKGACCTDDVVGSPCKDSIVEPGDCIGSKTCGDFGPEGCDSWTGTSLFVPGATCADDPCPVCEFEDEDHCQILDLQITFIARCDSFVGQDFRCADDFRAAESGILDRICWWPAFAPPAGSPECSDPGAAPADDYTVHVYPDLGNIPSDGDEITPAGGLPLNIDITSPVFGRIWQYSATVGDPGDPVVVLDAGECYWIEVNGIGNSACNIFWGQANKGNDHSMQDFNLPDYPHYTAEDTANTDLAWCLSLKIQSTPPLTAGCTAEVLGGCCLCPELGSGDLATCLVTNQDECGALSDPNGGVGKWKIRYKCSGSNFVCRYDELGNHDCPAGQGDCVVDTTQCDPNPCQGQPDNDLCEDAIAISHPGGDSSVVITTFYNVFCSDSEQPPTNCAVGGGDLSFGVWFSYTAPACGKVIVETCNSTPIFDSMGAIYAATDDGLTCAAIEGSAVPLDAACNDDGCGAGGPWHYELNVFEDSVYYIRAGSWWDGTTANIPRARDGGSFELTFEMNGETDPDNAHCGGTLGAPLAATYPHDRLKNRCIAFDPNVAANGTNNVAFKIELIDIKQGSCNNVESSPCRYAQGTGQNEPGNADCRRCASGPNVGLPCISGPRDCVGAPCNQAAETCSNNDPADGPSNLAGAVVRWAGLPTGTTIYRMVESGNPATDANVTKQAADTWPDVVHVCDCEIVPQATYRVTTVAMPSLDESATLDVNTIARPATGVFAWWADVAGSKGNYCNNMAMSGVACTPGPTACNNTPAACVLSWGPPNLFTNVDDTLAVLSVFTAFGPNPVNPVGPGAMATPQVMDITWADMHDVVPNRVANTADVQSISLAFQGRPYPFPDPVDCP